MYKLGIREVQWSDLEEISKLDLMDDDVMELRGMGSDDISVELVMSCVVSFQSICKCFYELDSGNIVGIYGISKHKMIWFLSSKDLMKYYMEFSKRTKKEFDEFTKGCGTVFNYVHHKHSRAIRWLTWLGLKQDKDPIQFTENGGDYYRMTYYEKE